MEKAKRVLISLEALKTSERIANRKLPQALLTRERCANFAKTLIRSEASQ